MTATPVQVISTSLSICAKWACTHHIALSMHSKEVKIHCKFGDAHTRLSRFRWCAICTYFDSEPCELFTIQSDIKRITFSVEGMLPRLEFQLPGVKNGLVLMRFEWHHKLSFSVSMFQTWRSLKLIDRWDEWNVGECFSPMLFQKRIYLFLLNWNVKSVKCYPRKNYKRKFQCMRMETRVWKRTSWNGSKIEFWPWF